MEKQNINSRLINEVCNEKLIEKIDLSYDWITILKKDNKERKIINNHFDLNSAVSVKLANDKYSTYEILKFYEIPIIQHNILFNLKIMPDYSYVNDNYKILKNNEKVVIKANNSSQGKDVYVCEDEKKKVQIVDNLFENGNHSVIVCPYMEIEYEYRALFLYGEIIYIYKKQKPFVVGDGVSNIGELINRNLKYFKEPLENLDFSYIPNKNEKVIVGWKHNLSNGAIPMVIDENDIYYNQIKDIALKTGKAMDLNYASIDIVITKKQEVYVMEVNASNVVVTKFCELVPDGFEIGKKIYSKVIDEMFEK